MRIITFTSSTGMSGGVRQAFYQTEGFINMGLEAYLCVPDTSPLALLGKPFVQVLAPQEANWRKDLESLFLDQQTVVHAFHNRAFKLTAYWGLFWLKKNIICVAHRGIITMPNNPLPYWSPAIRKIFPNSEACAKSLSWHCPKSKIKTVPNAIAEDRTNFKQSKEEVYAKYQLDPKNFYIAFTGNNNPVKGLDNLLQAFCSLTYPQDQSSLRLVLIGIAETSLDPVYQDYLAQRKIICLNFIEHVADILQISDLFIFPSIAMDSAPNALLEALALGLPIISTKVGGSAEILQDNGILINKNDATALSQAITKLYNDDELRKNYANKAKQRGQAYTVANRCNILVQEYKKLF